ncbi:uncharacterized protein LJ264_002170 [Porphyrio hochstetteri]
MLVTVPENRSTSLNTLFYTGEFCTDASLENAPVYPDPRPNICSQINADARSSAALHRIAPAFHLPLPFFHREDSLRAWTPSSTHGIIPTRPSAAPGVPHLSLCSPHPAPRNLTAKPFARRLRNHRRVRAPRTTTPSPHVPPRHPPPPPAGPPARHGPAAARVPAPRCSSERGSGTNFPCAEERSGAELSILPPRGAAMLGPAVRLALGAGELVPAAPGRLLALLWPALVLAAAALLVLRGLRRGRAGPGPRHPRRRAAGEAQEEEEGEEEDGAGGTGGRAAGALPAWRPEEQRRTAEVPVNGQLITSVNIREKKLLKPKKKRKAQCSDKEVPKDPLSVEKDRLQEEEGVWQTKISSREKRHLRKERLKQKDPSRASQGRSAVGPAFDWDEKQAMWPLTEDTSGGGKGALIAKTECGTTLKASGPVREESGLSQSEEDVFSNVGTWDIAEVKPCPVTFGTFSELSMELDNMKSKPSEDSPSRCRWHASSAFLPVDSAWQGQDDPSALDLDSDWKAPMEEWGNWTGHEEHQNEKEKDLPRGKADINFCLSGFESKTQRKKKETEVKEARGEAGLRPPQQGLETRMEEGPRDLISTKHSSDAVCGSFRKSLDVANNSPNNSVPGKKERRKRKKMKKET